MVFGRKTNKSRKAAGKAGKAVKSGKAGKSGKAAGKSRKAAGKSAGKSRKSGNAAGKSRKAAGKTHRREKELEESGKVVVKSRESVKHIQRLNKARIAGDMHAAEKHLVRAIKAEPEPNAVLLNELGVVRMERGAYGDAYDAFTDAIQINPADFIIYKNRAFTELALNQNTAALHDFDTAIELVCLDKRRATRAYYRELGDGRREALRRAHAHWQESDSS
ncbi:uncharacterized protein AMSG_07564 [Thecamonas trahens ATCC 50062]|uniref:Uncharacterized protein n=1 Tax=Thecamonas trahens ATCC 50062 TaxID=461836 RepID=A0A0L0DJ77_THETB|nr:hypothetical protein AMSG_07564 [Thecamonas trahens ATCC 50062]KNC51383.1 hypothetical protein AMSG_07564 [Thecamonas trahens ATCC 50062]|eukprot:XP_013756051.1 hypothetical protein AMSG_07564 [Thecamonas trahens ATCC 50062]